MLFFDGKCELFFVKLSIVIASRIPARPFAASRIRGLEAWRLTGLLNDWHQKKLQLQKSLAYVSCETVLLRKKANECKVLFNLYFQYMTKIFRPLPRKLQRGPYPYCCSSLADQRIGDWDQGEGD